MISFMYFIFKLYFMKKINWNIITAVIFILWIIIFMKSEVVEYNWFSMLADPMTINTWFFLFLLAIFIQLILVTLKIEKLLHDKNIWDNK